MSESPMGDSLKGTARGSRHLGRMRADVGTPPGDRFTDTRHRPWDSRYRILSELRLLDPQSYGRNMSGTSTMI